MASFDIIQAEYAATAVRRDQYPTDGLPEVAFLGRSNVGKSSLINSLCRHRGLARVSGAPGKTQTINYFKAALRCRDEEEGEQRLPFFLVDLPGYGFAKTGGKNRDRWSAFISEYVTGSENLCVLCREAYEWLASSGVPLQIVGTKADKLKANEKHRNLAQLNKLFPTGHPALAYSSLKNEGFGPLAKNLFSRLQAFTNQP